MAEILTGNWHLDPAFPPIQTVSAEGERARGVLWHWYSWRTGERAFCFILRPKLSAFRSTKLLYFGSKVVTIRVNVEFCCVTSVAYSSIYTAFVDYSKSSPLLSAAQILQLTSESPRLSSGWGVGDLHGWCIYLRSLTHVTLHVIGSNPLINKHNPITIGHVSYSWQNVVVTTTTKENKTNENVLES